MAITILADDGQYRLITDGHGGYGVLEARAGRVYALEPHQRHSARDDEKGMEAVIHASAGWQDKRQAWDVFAEMVEDEDLYARIIW